MLNHLMKHVLVYSAIVTMLGLTPMSYAESVKFIQWWDEYFPQKFEYSKVAFGYSRQTESQQYLDVNGDGVYNDALVCKKFSLTDFLNPYPQCFSDSKKNKRYRIDRPSALFYGGMVTRFTNVSHLTEKNKKGEDVPIFNRVGQASVQPTEGAKPNFYDPKYPENTRRAGSGNWGLGWADMTYHLNLYGPIFETFDATENAEINFSAVFLWKKEDFVNGGASANVITFDKTSKLSVDVARFRENVEECRFVVQDGNQLWISEYAYIVEGSPPAKAELNPLDSHWAIYNPSDCDIDFNKEEAVFTKQTFEDVQAVGVYFATDEFAHKRTGLSFDNIQVYATSTPSPEMPIEPNLIGNAIDSEGNPVSTDAKFSRGISVNGDTVTVRSSDQMDIRGVITVDSNHVDKEAEILVVVGYKPASIEKESFFMFNKEGKILPWNKDIANLLAYEETDWLKNDKGRFKQKIILAPERRVQIFPVTLSAFRANELDTILLGCEERPQTYLGFLNDVPPGLLRFFFGYRLKEDGTVVYNSESVNVRITN
ncbi:MAG: hypothetical protein DRQ49_18365 [Gammaproteobacteria bacterium]|nr:MAG: hypothetical protein DRQ49_18365 [Gammaproteobacteria bacterium]